ncbi:hypothetical protein AQS8620_01469 [Aquimixticola soesokkakensis]|uniref:N-(5'-phosphoribosyl)anthranilate isomerase n=1 Tax=Aquimixticola soesokkakensis TaxID=1519096 RepID=A0A1Y5SFD2_9RHOB|nr:hypothetical protein AQS8620_01469 [Aquimixticola soesokkakensis]
MTYVPSSSRVPVQSWVDQIFDARAAHIGGVVRRAKRDVDREIGRDRLELECRRRGFHLVTCGAQYVIFCTQDPVEIIC